MKSREDWIDDILSYMEMSEAKQPTRSSFHNCPLSYFKEAVPLISDVTKSLIFFDAKPRDLDNQFDSTLLRARMPGEVDTAHYQLTRLRRIHPHEVRGQTKRIFPIMADMRTALIQSEGTFFTHRALFGWNGSEWIDIDTMSTGNDYRPLQNSIRACLGSEFSKRYDWGAVLKYSEGPSIRLNTDPIGARELFKLRDIPNGSTRRKALRHWVSEHWRQKRSDPNEAKKVREHLRGATVFSWNGLNVEIKPSAFDLERNEQSA